MNDLISRQVALAVYQTVCINVKCDDCPFRIVDGNFTDCRLERLLHELPSAEPEVSCKYCRHFKSDFWCAWWEGTVGFNDYCSKGERWVHGDRL